ncbi:MAG: VanZ family protein [Kiritimatiellales bacterium]
MRIGFFILALMYSALIVFLSSLPDLTPPDIGIKLSDKLIHFAEYVIFAFLWGLALWRNRAPGLPALLIFIISGLLFAVSDEFHQSFVPGRDADVRDFLADAGGIITVILFFLIRRRPAVLQTEP